MSADTRRSARRAVSVRACAKINLTLRVLGARADGFHDLRTTFQTLALHDTLTFRAAPDAPFAIECSDPTCPRDRGNLVWRAADMLWRGAGRSDDPDGVTVRIVKRIPSQAGLGGASSDAFAALAGLATLWKLRLNADQQAAMAREIGSDVPFFADGGRALGIGRGQTLFPLVDGPSRPVVLAVPPFGVSTADAYRWWDRAEEGRLAAAGTAAARPIHRGDAARWATATGLALPAEEWANDLQPPVALRHPAIDRLAAALREAGAVVSAMSGSGSVVFGLFDTKARAVRAAKALSSGGGVAIVTETLGRAAYRRLVRPVVLGR